jgi:hypothetical protein
VRARELRYGDVLRSISRPEYVIMFLGYGDDPAAQAMDWAAVLPLAGSTVSRDNGTVSRMNPIVLGWFELLESGPELPGTA